MAAVGVMDQCVPSVFQNGAAVKQAKKFQLLFMR
jgi:hypothetical protein